MKKILNLNPSFIKSLIDLDFPFVKTRTKDEKLNSVALRLNLKNTNQFHILDIFKLNNSLKQFIRILYSIKYCTTHNNKVQNSKFLIYIWCSNKFILELIQQFIDEFKIAPFIVLCDLFPTLDRSTTYDKQKFLFVLGNPWTENTKHMLHHRILFNNIFLVNTLNFQRERPQLGFFKIQNDLADYKKLLVLLVIIERVIGNRKWIIPQRNYKIKNKT